MGWLTPAERRAVILVAMLFALGAGRDLWRAHHPRELPRPAPFSGGMREPTADPRAPEPGRDGSGAIPLAPDPGAAAGGDRPRDRPEIGRVDLNRASVEELDRLPGVGPVLAHRIVEHRRRQGRIREVDELLAVRGIGPRLIERLRPHVLVSDP